MDEPLCDLGIPCFLCVFLILLGRSHLASTFSSSHCAFLGECPVLALAVQHPLIRGILRFAGGKVCAILLLALLSEEGMPPSNTHQKPVLEEGWWVMRCVWGGLSPPEGRAWKREHPGHHPGAQLWQGVFAFLPPGSFLVLRLLPLLGGSRVNLLGSVSACGCERQKEFVVERTPMKQK